jgi:hypothetical protein
MSKSDKFTSNYASFEGVKISSPAGREFSSTTCKNNAGKCSLVMKFQFVIFDVNFEV